MGNRLYVGNLDFQVNPDDLRQLFSGAGQVTSVKLIVDRDTERSKGFGFVEMADSAAATQAIALYNGFVLNERAIAVSEARPMGSGSAPAYANRMSEPSRQPNFRQVKHKSRGGAKRRF